MCWADLPRYLRQFTNFHFFSVGVGIGDQYVKIAFAEASAEVDRAINKTIDNIVNNKSPRNPADLFRIIRYPDAPARELARAAEVYERTLVNIRKHVEKENKMMVNHTTDFNYKEILSPEHLELIARLSGKYDSYSMWNDINDLVCIFRLYDSQVKQKLFGYVFPFKIPFNRWHLQ